MSDQISWHVQLAVKPGQIDNFRALTTEMVESASQEAGVLNYERFVSADGNFVHVYERYTGSDVAPRVAALLYELVHQWKDGITDDVCLLS